LNAIAATRCVVRGGGDLATGVVQRLAAAGFPVIVLELEQPRVVRRLAAVAEAMFAGEARIETLVARRASPEEAVRMTGGVIPVVADPAGAALASLRPQVVVDARMAKAPLDTSRATAPFVVALGPGFVAGEHCSAVIETHRGHDLGRVIWRGAALPDTGEPEAVLGQGSVRVLRAPADGVLHARAKIGAIVEAAAVVADVGGQPVRAPFRGCLRGLLHDGLAVVRGEKIGDVDPRCEPRYCDTISDKARAVGGGVLEAVLAWLSRS
jgi:xanthine dehydrogenase accessory factor